MFNDRLTSIHLKAFIRTHAWLLRIGAVTAVAIIGFEVIGQLVIYRFLKLDFYLSLVAIAFLATGLLLKRSSASEAGNHRPTPATDTSRPIGGTIAAIPVIPAGPPTGTDPLSDLLALLTSKEFLVLRLLAEGKTNKEIAVIHSVEVSTVKTHVNNIYAKLSVSNRAQARARYAEIATKLPIS